MKNVWTHRDLLRLAHPKAEGSRAQLFSWICKNNDLTNTGTYADDLKIIEGFERVQLETSGPGAAKLIAEYHLPWEAVPDALLTKPEVWEAIIDSGMGITALIRNLARLTRLKIISPLSLRTSQICDRISNADQLVAGKVHPIQMLDALVTYANGQGARGDTTWTPVAPIVDALDAGFYASFGAVVPANKSTLLALDVSGSMGFSPIAGSAVLTPRTASCAMALVTAATEKAHHVCAFSHLMVPVSISPRERMDDLIKKTNDIPFGRTDCALPMAYAQGEKLEVETFVIYTDSETWSGSVHPMQALRAYRDKSGINARLVVCGMTSTGFSIADPQDAGSMDVVGFDSATPNVISNFSAGLI